MLRSAVVKFIKLIVILNSLSDLLKYLFLSSTKTLI